MPRSTSAAVDAAKSRAQHLAARLKALGVNLRHTQALEALAASEGFRDWNRYQAHLESSPQHLPRPSVERKRVLFLGRPGTGKTRACMEWAFALSSPRPLWENGISSGVEGTTAVLWVEGVPDTSNYDTLPSHVKPSVDRIEVLFDENGVLLPGALQGLPNGRSWWVHVRPAFSAPSMYSQAGEKIYAAAMDAVLEALRPHASHWGRVVFEELRHSPDALEAFLSRFARMPWAQAVVNAQTWLVDTAPESLGASYLVVGECRRAPAVTHLPQHVPIHHQMSVTLNTALNYLGTP